MEKHNKIQLLEKILKHKTKQKKYNLSEIVQILKEMPEKNKKN